MGTLPDPTSTDNAEFKIVLTILKCLLDAGVTDKWNKIATRCNGVSEETTTGVHRIYSMEKSGELLFTAINVNDCGIIPLYHLKAKCVEHLVAPVIQDLYDDNQDQVTIEACFYLFYVSATSYSIFPTTPLLPSNDSYLEY